MPEQALPQILADAIAKYTRAAGKLNIGHWLEGLAGDSGDVLVLVAPTKGHQVVEVHFRSGNFPAALA